VTLEIHNFIMGFIREMLPLLSPCSDGHKGVTDRCLPTLLSRTNVCLASAARVRREGLAHHLNITPLGRMGEYASVDPRFPGWTLNLM
jgi:hypothetical protein